MMIWRVQIFNKEVKEVKRIAVSWISIDAEWDFSIVTKPSTEGILMECQSKSLIMHK